MPNLFSNGFGYYAVIIVIVILLYYLYKKIGAPKFNFTGSGTPFLDSYAVDFTRQAKIGRIDPVIGREEEVLKLAQILSRRTKNNAVLVGPSGVGKTAIVEGLAQRIVKGEVPEALLNKRVLALDVPGLLSGTKYRGEFEQRAKRIVQEISSRGRSIILFIDEAHSVVQSQGTEGAVNFSDILKPALARGDLQMIGATTMEEYEKYFKPEPSLDRRFQLIQVDEPSEAETLQILQGVKDKYREYHKVEFTDAALETAVRLSKELVRDRKLPDKAIDAMDEAAAMIKVSHVRSSIPMILYQAALAAHPEVAELWSKIQKLDAEIAKAQGSETLESLSKERERLEAELSGKGVVAVDCADVEKVIRGWMV